MLSEEMSVMRRRDCLGKAAAMILAAVAVLVGGCGAERARPRVVLIGIDGADWAIIDSLAAEGRLPHLSALRARGVSGPIATVADIPLSPVIWTSVATGKRADKHGITWFMVDRQDGTRAPVRSHNRKTKALWNILAENERVPISVGWWATYPAEDVGEGVVVSDAVGFHGFGGTARGDEPAGKTHPPELFREVYALFPAEQQISPDFARRFIHLSPEEYREKMFDPGRYARHDPENPIHLFQQYAVTAQGYAAIAERLLESRPYDLFLVYFEQVDSFSHLFMKYAPPRLAWIEAADFERYRDAVAEWYVYQDELLGRLLERIDLDTTAVVVASDHGFKTGERRIRSEETVDVRRARFDHEPEGILLAAGPQIRHSATIDGASVLDIAPTLLHYLGLPVAKDMDGKVLEDLFEPGFRQAHAIRYVASYEDPSGPESASEPAEEYAAEDLEENLAALRTLGYVEEESEESSPEIHNSLGVVHMAAGDLDAARAEFEKALALDAGNAEALINLGEIAEQRGDHAEAQRLAARALSADPNSPAAMAQLGELAGKRGELDEAIRLFQQALALDDSRSRIFMGLGDALRQAGRYPEAEQAFRRVLELEPDSFEARFNLAVTASDQGHDDQARGLYEESLSLQPRHALAASAHNNLAGIHLARGDREAAIANFEQAVALEPDHFESNRNLGLQYLEMGRGDEAIARLEAAAAIDATHEETNTGLGVAYMRAGRTADAYRIFLLVRRLYPQNWKAPLGLALLHTYVDRSEDARQLLDEALELGGAQARKEANASPALAELLEPSPASD
jgi:tetratricopeptide (TPR) repeat protein